MRLSWITEHIAVGTPPNEEDLNELQQMGIEAIIDVRSEDCDDETLIEKMGIKFLHIEVDDGYSPALEQLKEIFEFANPLLDEGKKILIHCRNGYGRSPLVIIALLIERGMSTFQAVNLVEKNYPLTMFTPFQEIFIRSLEERLKK